MKTHRVYSTDWTNTYGVFPVLENGDKCMGANLPILTGEL